MPKIHWFGVVAPYRCLVMTYYDCSLYDYISKNPPFPPENFEPSKCVDEGTDGRLVEKSITPDFHRIIESLLKVLQSIHDSGVVHRDIKLQNIMFKGDQAVLVDFGMATFWVDEAWRPIPESDTPKEDVMGSLHYMSYHVHAGKTYSRRDDLMSLAYVYMSLNGDLFWRQEETPNTLDVFSNLSDGLPATNIMHPKNQRIKTQKEWSCIREYFQRKGRTDSRLFHFLEYVYGLAFSETPRYMVSKRSIVGAS